MTELVHVAVGVILDKANRVLIALRDSSQHQGGLWEFPGGKLEVGENVQQALARELLEEVNLEVLACQPMLKVSHDYGDKQVLLDVWTVDEFRGSAKGVEGQEVRWVELVELDRFEFPVANLEISAALKSRFLL